MAADGSTPRVRVRAARELGPGFALALGASWLAVPAVQAQDAAPDAAQERSQAFKAVQGAVKEDVPGGPLLIGAYAALWLIVFALVWRLVRKQQRAETDLARLERVLQKAEAPRSES